AWVQVSDVDVFKDLNLGPEPGSLKQTSQAADRQQGIELMERVAPAAVNLGQPEMGLEIFKAGLRKYGLDPDALMNRDGAPVEDLLAALGGGLPPELMQGGGQEEMLQLPAAQPAQPVPVPPVDPL